MTGTMTPTVLLLFLLFHDPHHHHVHVCFCCFCCCFQVKEYAPLVFASLRDKVFSYNSRSLFRTSLVDPVDGPPTLRINSFIHQNMVQVPPSPPPASASTTTTSTTTTATISGSGSCCNAPDHHHYYNFGHNVLYVSADQQILVKSIDGNDVEGLISLLKSLHPYLVTRNSPRRHHHHHHQVVIVVVVVVVVTRSSTHSFPTIWLCFVSRMHTIHSLIK